MKSLLAHAKHRNSFISGQFFPELIVILIKYTSWSLDSNPVLKVSPSYFTSVRKPFDCVLFSTRCFLCGFTS